MRLEQDEADRRYRMTWDDFEARVRVWLTGVEEKPLELGQPVAWMTRENGKANTVSAIHHYHEDGRTFCRLDIPPTKQHLPVLPSLDVCKRCAAMSRRALHYAQLASMRASA